MMIEMTNQGEEEGILNAQIWIVEEVVKIDEPFLHYRWKKNIEDFG